MMSEGRIVGRVANMDMIGHVRFGGRGIVNGMDDAVVSRHGVVVDVDEVCKYVIHIYDCFWQVFYMRNNLVKTIGLRQRFQCNYTPLFFEYK